jgi:uncharacterized protein YlxP (DUF503 family)
MFVAVARIVLSIPGARSLKDRRQVVRSFRDRARARLSVSIAEVGDLERYQVATLGAAVVGRDSAHCSELLSEVTRMARGLREALVADVATEIIPFGAGGSGVRGGIEQVLEDAPDADSEDENEDEP